VRGGRNASGIDRLELLGIVEDIGELSRKQLFLLVSQFELRQRRDALDVGYGERGHLVIM
jgi:hypothetical protein